DHVRHAGRLGAHAPAQHPAPLAGRQGTGARSGPSALVQRLLCGARVVLLGHSSRHRQSVLSEVTPPTGEPDAGDPPVRFGGRGSVTTFSLPLSTFSLESPGKPKAFHFYDAHFFTTAPPAPAPRTQGR